MTIRHYLFAFFTMTLLALGSFLAIFFNTEPTTGDRLLIYSFFASLWLVLWGVVGFPLYFWMIKRENISESRPHLQLALRHSALVATIIVGLLLMSSYRVLTWWGATIFVLIILVLEFYFRTKKL